MDNFLNEYNSEKAVLTYTKETAGFGIAHLLENDYGKIYKDIFVKYLHIYSSNRRPRILEFGCGGGMNLLHIIMMLEKQGIFVDSAFGTDFSEKLISAAKNESIKYLSISQQKKLTFCVARNENLIQDMVTQLNIRSETLLESFDLILGINTSRYCHRLRNEMEYAQNIKDLLIPGGICIIIDMNSKFPFFRSRVLLNRSKARERIYYLPTLEEYSKPFEILGFEILKMHNFCWIPHSAGPLLTKTMEAMTPVLDRLGRQYAMRSLVVARKAR